LLPDQILNMLDWVLKKEDLPDKHYILTSSRAFLCRYADTGFRTKWCGFWGPPIKHLEYYAYHIRSGSDQWLSWDDCSDFTLNPWGAVHRFKVPEFDVHETVFIPESSSLLVSVLRIRNNGPKKKVAVILEAAVNMRRKGEDWHAREYDSEFSEVRNWVIVKTQARPWFTGFGVGRMDRKIAITFSQKNQYKEHNPGSPQRCFLPGDYEVSFDMEAGEEIEVPFVFSCSSRSMEEASHGFDSSISSWKSLLNERIRISGPGKQIIRTPDKDLNRAFVWNAMALRYLLHRSGNGIGIFAGLPWFLEFWARDSFICIPGLDNIGEFQASQKILEMFLSNDMPSKIDTEGNLEYGFADTHPLFLLAMEHYSNCSGSQAFLKEGKSILSKMDIQTENGLIVHDPEKTWMDTLKRGKSALEVQSLWSAALGRHNQGLSKDLENKVKVEYWNPKTNYFHDSKNPEMEDITANALAPIMLGHADGQKVSSVLDRMHSEFSTKWGVRTRSVKDSEYRADAYHKGAVWGLVTGAAACAFLKHNRVHQGLGCLKSMASEMGSNALGCSAEVLDADTGKLLGCGMQAWSSAMFITAVDEFLFGIKPNLPDSTLLIHPRMPDAWDYMERFGKRIGDRTMDMMMRRDHTRLSLDMNFDSAPSLKAKLILPSNIKKAVANGKVFIGNVLEFDLKKQNNIVALQ
jgi:hypothetical protein